VRLLTLTGPGGTGKTRVALRLAEELAGDFADGVRFVPLAATTEPELVVAAIGQAVGVQESPARSLTESLQDHLRDQRMLLVLDNFEQVVSAASLIAQLLVACAHLKVLATSRVVLRVTGEQTYPVSPLQLPDPKLTASVEQVGESEAVWLFVARAQAAKPSFGLTAGNVGAVAELCRGLDGLPLAIELAAARVRLLSPQAMLLRLGNRLALLTGGAQDLPARQQTVRATLDWSYDLLDEPERRLLRRLSVFAGGCTLEAAEAVCGPEGEMDVFGEVSSLVDGSLLRQEEGPDGETRLWMLETIREYALARLVESGEEGSIRGRQAR
jgi:predicted ATPase